MQLKTILQRASPVLASTLTWVRREELEHAPTPGEWQRGDEHEEEGDLCYEEPKDDCSKRIVLKEDTQWSQ